MICKPICNKFNLTMPAFEILMSLANVPHSFTASDISKFRSFKPNLVSFHVDKLVKAGYIERQRFEGNRRSIKLVLTNKAVPVIEQGKKLQNLYEELISQNMTDEDKASFLKIAQIIGANIENIKTGIKNGTITLE